VRLLRAHSRATTRLRLSSNLTCPIRQAQARFIIQLREPVSRMISYLQMERRFNRSDLAVETSIVTAQSIWNQYSADRPEWTSATALFASLNDCTVNKSKGGVGPAQCHQVAMTVANLGAAVMGGCSQPPMTAYDVNFASFGGTSPLTGCRSGYSPALSRGMYAPQLVFLLSQFSRSQVLLLSMDTFKSTDKTSYMQSILDFARIPATIAPTAFSSSSQLNRAGDHLDPMMDLARCTSRDALGEFYAPWNQVLYALEPDFPPFASFKEVKCM